MSKIPSVFISYPRDGKSGQSLAFELHERLLKEGIPAFIDEYNIRMGDRWLQTLSEGVKHCKIMLSVVSPASHDRPWVEKEYIAATEVKALIIPVLATDGPLPFQINDLQAARLYGESKEKQLKLVLERVSEEYANNIRVFTREEEVSYLRHLLEDNEDRALSFASKVYCPLAGRFSKENKRIAVAAMSPRLRHRRRTQYDEPKEVSENFTEYEDIISAFKRNSRLVILGEPGAGKTYSLWRIAAKLAEEALENVKQPLPVIVPLNRWDDPSQSLHDFILQQMSSFSEYFEDLYRAKLILPLFDALNEIPFDQREQKLPQLRDWLTKYTFNSLLLTCRKRDYRGPLDLDMDRLTIEPLDPPRIYNFLHSYFNTDKKEYDMAEKLFWELAGGEKIKDAWQCWLDNGCQDDWDSFWVLNSAAANWNRKVKGHEHNRKSCLSDPRSMMKLASNPYLLTQIVMIFSESEKLPENRIELFTEFVDDLIFRETEARAENHYPKAQQKELRSELIQLAWQLQSRTGSLVEARTTIGRSDAEKIMPLSRLEFSAAASLLELSKDSVRFSHQLLQEFFTAQSFEEKREAGLQATDLWDSQSWWEANGWEEVVKLAADYENDPASLLKWLAKGNPRLAVEIAFDQGLSNSTNTLFLDYKDLWQKSILDINNHSNPHERNTISTVLAWLEWDERDGIGLNYSKLPDIDWITIPKGEFTYGQSWNQKRLMISEYQISKYPITNCQYQSFIDAGGYENKRWWFGLKKPDQLPEKISVAENRPVEGINWYESLAYCRWLSHESGFDISLPTEQQWEKAARGPNAKKYPWGDNYLPGFANIYEHPKKGLWYCLSETSAVGIYPQGQSPYGVMDMSGNVWEWCLNKYEDSDFISLDLTDHDRVVRGGSFTSNFARCAASLRVSGVPSYRRFKRGFRIIRSGF